LLIVGAFASDGRVKRISLTFLCAFWRAISTFADWSNSTNTNDIPSDEFAFIADI
jgi:hypothetical protein